MIRRESQFQTNFSKWCKYNWPLNEPAYFELKCARTSSLPFSAVSDKQLYNLQLKRLIHKFSDMDRLGTPFDMVCFSGKGYVVIQYYRPGNKEFFIIEIERFLEEKNKSQRKSLTEDTARVIGITHYFPV